MLPKSSVGSNILLISLKSRDFKVEFSFQDTWYLSSQFHLKYWNYAVDMLSFEWNGHFGLFVLWCAQARARHLQSYAVVVYDTLIPCTAYENKPEKSKNNYGITWENRRYQLGDYDTFWQISI